MQRIKSEGCYDDARELVERYGVKVDAALHDEVLTRYGQLGLAPYKGFINPYLMPIYDEKGNYVDLCVGYSEAYDHQMLRYSREYGTLV